MDEVSTLTRLVLPLRQMSSQTNKTTSDSNTHKKVKTKYDERDRSRATSYWVVPL